MYNYYSVNQCIIIHTWKLAKRMPMIHLQQNLNVPSETIVSNYSVHTIVNAEANIISGSTCYFEYTKIYKNIYI